MKWKKLLSAPQERRLNKFSRPRLVKELEAGRLQIVFEKLVDKSEMPETFGKDAAAEGTMKMKVTITGPSDDK